MYVAIVGFIILSFLMRKPRLREFNQLVPMSHSWNMGVPGFEPTSVCLGVVTQSKQVINRSADIEDLCFPALCWVVRETKDSVLL